MDKQIFLLKLNDAFAEIAKYARGFDYDKQKIQEFLPLLNHRFGKHYYKESPYRPCKLCKGAEILKSRWERGERDCTYCRQKLRNKKYRAKMRRMKDANLEAKRNGCSNSGDKKTVGVSSSASQDPRR